MGGGASSEQAEQLNAKLDRLNQQLDQLNATGGPRRRASAVGQGVLAPAPPADDSPRTGGTGRKAAFTLPGETAPQPPPTKKVGVVVSNSPRDVAFEEPASHAVGSPRVPSDKKSVAAAKQKRKDFFEPLFAMKEIDGEKKPQDWNEIQSMPGVKCVWLGCAALGLSYVSKETVSIESILKNNELALHYVSFPSVTLAELFDIVQEYCERDAKMKTQDIRAEVATFESELLEEGEETQGTGDRAPVLSLAAFRKEMASEQGNPDSLYIFNYNPFLVQEAEAQQRAMEAEEEDEEDEEDEDGNPIVKEKKPRVEPPRQWQAKNMGQFSILTAYNPALHSVNLATPHLSPDGQFKLEVHTCSLQTLYQATKHPDGYTKRARGFVKIFRASQFQEQPVKSMFPVTTIDGRNSRGLLSIALDIAIAPNILGLGILHHLASAAGIVTPTSSTANTSEGVSGFKGAVQLSGLLADLVDTLRLPLHVLVGGTGGASMLPQAVSWYLQFLERREITTANIGYVPVTRRDNAEDGAVSVSEDDFMAAVTTAVNTTSLMMVCFDVNQAQNVLITSEQKAHFAVVVGVDDHRGIVKLADVSVKKYRKVWHLPLMRLYHAVIGYGFMMVSGSEIAANTCGGVERAKQLLRSTARYRLPPPRPAVLQGPSTVFEYPRKNYSVTVLASVLTQLGYPTSVEDLCYGSGFHLSFLLSEHIPMLDAARILSYYSHTKLSDEVAVLATTFDSAETFSLMAFKSLLKGASNSQPSTRDSKDGTPNGNSPDNAPAESPGDVFNKSILIVAFDQATIQKDISVWNGSSGGNLAQVVGFDPIKGTAMLVDSNPEAYYRQWECPVDLLHEACCKKDRITDRPRGFLRLTRQRSETYASTKSIDMRRAMVHHPFKIPISSTASASSLALSELTGSPVSSEDILYSNSNFSLGKLTADITPGDTVNLVKSYVTTRPNGEKFKVSIAYDASTKANDGSKISTALVKAGVDSAVVMDILLYDVGLLWGEQAASNSGQTQGAGVFSHCADGQVMVVDGNPTRFGASWKCSMEKLQSITLGIVRIEFSE